MRVDDRRHEVVERRFAVMGTTAHIVLTDAPVDLLDAAETYLRRCERRWSRFVATSELSVLNRSAGRLTIVSEATYGLVALAINAWWSTGGAFDPTVHDALCQLGYDRDFASIGSSRAAPPPAPAPGCAGIELFPPCRGVRLPSGVHLDLGGIAKGYAADRLVECLLEAGAAGACVNVGGDIRVEGCGPHDGPWVIALDHGQTVAPSRVALVAGAVCTSSRARRRWCVGSDEAHHLIDPRSGRSVDEGLAWVSVIARHAAQAEVLTKAVFLAGPDIGRVLLEELGVAGVLVRDDNVIIEAGNLRELTV